MGTLYLKSDDFSTCHFILLSHATNYNVTYLKDILHSNNTHCSFSILNSTKTDQLSYKNTTKLFILVLFFPVLSAILFAAFVTHCFQQN